MDIKEVIKYSKNKIEADDLAKQVKRRIKKTAWEKQNQIEGFSESFKPLISQFEKPEDSKKENIFTQNQKMLRYQLALTEGLRDNQLALTEGLTKALRDNQLALKEGLRDNQLALTKGFEQFERFADMKELPQIDYDENYDPYYDYFLKEKQMDEEPESEEPESEEKVLTYNLEKDFTEEELEDLDILGYPRPNDFLKTDHSILIKMYDDVVGEKIK